MIGFKVNGRFLELKPATTAEIERKSPFFGMEDSISEVSTSLTFPYTTNNALALGMPFQYFTERKKIKINAEQYDGNSYRGTCTLVLETGKLNLNNVEATEITGYVLYGISNFYQEVKGKKLSDLSLGGIRSFTYTTNMPFDGTNGFWQHAHATWTDDTIPYIFQPIRNEAYYGENGDVDWMNKLNNQATLLYDFRFPLVPIIRLKYLLEQIFLETGFTVDFSGLNDSEWQKLLLLNLTKVDWYGIQPVAVDGHIEMKPAPLGVVKIDLKKHVPQDKLISDFIVQLFNRYGWAPLFDPMSRVCRLVAVKEAESGPVKDWTAYADPSIESNFSQDPKTFSFTNEIDSNDSLPSTPDFSNLKIGGPAVYARYLPPPTAADERTVRFCYHDNQWWQVKYDTTNKIYDWVLYADNIYNEEPQGSTDTISTTISTLPCYLTNYRTENGIEYAGYFPAMKQEASKNIGYRTLLYYGMVQELALNGSGSGSPLFYPHASSTRESADGTNPLTWSNVWRHDYGGGTIFEQRYGIIEYWWKRFLNVLKAGEEKVITVRLPLHELLKFRWDDRILIRNVSYLVKSFIEPLPYTGFIQATMKRLTKAPIVIAPVAPPTDPGGGTTPPPVSVFAKLVSTIVRISGTGWVFYYSDIFIQLFADKDGTIPYTPVFPLSVSVQKDIVDNKLPANNATTYQTFSVSAPNTKVLADTQTKVRRNESTGDWITEARYSLDPLGANGYQIIP